MCEAQNKNHMKYESLERDCGHSVPVKMRKFSAMHLGAFPHCPALIYSEVWNTRSPGAPTSSLASQTPNPPCWSLIASNTVSKKKRDEYPSSIRGEAHRNAREVYSGMRLTASRQERYWNHILWCITDGIITDNHDLILFSFFIFVDFNLWKRFPVLIPCFQLQFFLLCNSWQAATLAQLQLHWSFKCCSSHLPPSRSSGAGGARRRFHPLGLLHHHLVSRSTSLLHLLLSP